MRSLKKEFTGTDADLNQNHLKTEHCRCFMRDTLVRHKAEQLNVSLVSVSSYKKRSPWYTFIKMSFFFFTSITHFHDNTNSLFKHGQNPIQVSLLLQQTGLTDPVFSKLLGQHWQPCQNCLHLVRRAPLQTLVELKKEHLDPLVKVLIKAHLQHTLPIPL